MPEDSPHQQTQTHHEPRQNCCVETNKYSVVNQRLGSSAWQSFHRKGIICPQKHTDGFPFLLHSVTVRELMCAWSFRTKLESFEHSSQKLQKRFWECVHAWTDILQKDRTTGSWDSSSAEHLCYTIWMSPNASADCEDVWRLFNAAHWTVLHTYETKQSL